MSVLHDSVIRLVMVCKHAKTNSPVYFLKFHRDSAKYSACLRSQRGRAAAEPGDTGNMHSAISRRPYGLSLSPSPVALRSVLLVKRSGPTCETFSRAADTHEGDTASLTRNDSATFIHKFHSTDALQSASVAWADERPSQAYRSTTATTSLYSQFPQPPTAG